MPRGLRPLRVFAIVSRLLQRRYDVDLVNIFLFVSPLRKLLRDIEKSGAGQSSKTSSMMVATAYKYTILTVITTMTTVVFLFIIIATGIEFPAGADMIINCICIFLLCPYYPDNKYYSVYCKLCIRCCDRSGISSGGNSRKQMEKTADTESKDERTSNLEPTTTSQTLGTTSSTGYTNTNTNNTIT